MNERRNEPHPLELEQWLLSEQAASARVATEARLSASEQTRLRAEDAALRRRLFESVPPLELARRVQRKLGERAPSGATKKRASHGLYALGAAVLMTAALLVVLRAEPSHQSAQETSRTASSERAKGAALALSVYRQRGAQVERLTEGAQASPHELVQLGYARGRFSHGVVLSIDGRGGVTLHFPRAPGESTALAQSGETLLSEAYELDDAPAFERFLLVAAERPLSVEQVLRAARSLAATPALAQTSALELDVPHEQRSLLLRKSAPR